jgi:signal transduction histidine kinase
VRHATARSVTVTVHYGPLTEVTVADDGTGSQAPFGHGLTGMRERVAMLDGEMTAGPTDDGGYEVAVFLPVPMSAPAAGGDDEEAA